MLRNGHGGQSLLDSLKWMYRTGSWRTESSSLFFPHLINGGSWELKDNTPYLLLMNLVCAHSHSDPHQLFSLLVCYFLAWLSHCSQASHGFAPQPPIHSFSHSCCSHWWGSCRCHAHGHSLLRPMQGWTEIPLRLSPLWYDTWSTTTFSFFKVLFLGCCLS